MENAKISENERTEKKESLLTLYYQINEQNIIRENSYDNGNLDLSLPGEDIMTKTEVRKTLNARKNGRGAEPNEIFIELVKNRPVLFVLNATNSIPRLYRKIIRNRMENEISNVDEQNGFHASI